ncbi:MCP methyltransferase, CheR-type, SAM-binding domain, C-terminal [Gemmatirosa kalamazoonensis]|jgi:chemotaxis protein methyltransferase CheR|uniref:MCP methyltransferase, CheR-type, SAM-binding domain, C-terminal n=1 Tax=Gemmatirosa kalamazoonensis TaxID=861299 RepID=W0RAW5_9BACT|nr:protein-glutamate O-methyltransferase CheR [Gemmatirosa kalamazoonensis]AHG87607.1 MCP methyltransferase, CheR-type, SAM-binding domain, C-terminal [Gemmatirosa kalamazoonensis]
MTLPAAPTHYDPALERIEIELLLEAVHRHYGFDFRGYAYSSLRRRVWKRIQAEGLSTVSALQDRVLHDTEVMERLLDDLSVTVTAMFRDPGFYQTFRETVVPILRTYPFIRIWHAGCSTGEEVYSMAILLHEEDLYDRARVYATDMNETVLRRARDGIFPLERMQEYTENYIRAGGRRSFSEYYTSGYNGALFDASLKRNVVFAQHNLVTDGSFTEFNVVLCRNVLIYFDKALQTRVHGLFYDSLTMFGILALGSKESLRFSKYDGCYEPLVASEKIYRKIQ